MINTIIDAITIRLHELYGDNYNYYSENIKQGFIEPCFFVSTIEVLNQNLLGNRRKLVVPFDISCHLPDSFDKNQQFHTILDTLYSKMRFITAISGTKFIGTDMSGEIVDDVLHFIVKYNTVMNSVTAEESMEDLQLDNLLKG